MTISLTKQIKLLTLIVVNIMLNGWMTGSYTGGVLTSDHESDYDHLQQG